MGEVSFVKKDVVPADAAVVESVTQVAGEVPVVRTDKVIDIVATPVVPAAPAAPATPALPMVPVAAVPVAVAQTDEPPMFYDDENIGFNDIRLPRINIVQKTGEMSNVFQQGEIVLNQVLPIYTPPVLKDGAIVKPGTKPLNLIILGFRKKQYVEKVASATMGALCNTEEEVGRLNGTLSYKEHETKVANGIPSKLFQELATAIILIEKPEHLADADHIEFAHECEGRYYALVLWGMKGGSYTNGYKAFATARKMGHLKTIRVDGKIVGGGYISYSWSLGTKLETYKTGNFAWIPVVTNGAKSTPKFLEFARNLLGAS